MDETSLTAIEVEALSDNTPIIVIWSGGNGPHRYFKKSIDGCPVAAVEWEIETGRLDSIGKSLGSWPNGFVGQEQYHTRVWLDLLNER